jgi:hypothetical protein
MLDLDRADAKLAFVPEDIEQELRRFGDRVERERSVIVPIEAEIGHGLEIVEPGASQGKKLPSI